MILSMSQNTISEILLVYLTILQFKKKIRICQIFGFWYENMPPGSSSLKKELSFVLLLQFSQLIRFISFRSTSNEKRLNF